MALGDTEQEQAQEQQDAQLFAQFDGLDPIALVRALDQWQQDKARLEEELKVVNKVFDFLRITRIPTAFEEAGVEMLRVAGIGRCSLTADLHASIPKSSRDEAYQWLRDHGRGDLITDYVLPSTLKAAVKRAITSGEVLPGCFVVSPFTRASITRE